MLPPDAERILETYLREVGRRLPGPARTRRDVLDELRDGLLEAAAALQGGGVAPPEAIRMATDQFGTPAQVAAAHAPELGIRRSRHCSWRVLALLLAAGLTWLGYRYALGDPRVGRPRVGR